MEHHYEKVEDILVHEGDDYAKFMGSVAPPIYQSSLFVRPTTANGIPEHPYAYTRASNPTVEAVEKKIAALEGAEAALCFSSGMAAITSAIMHFVEKDCHVITVKSIYGPARNFLCNYLPKKFGVKTSFLSCEEMEHIEDFITEDTRLIYLESPSSGVFRLQDLEYIATLAKEHGIGTVIDNTYATSLYQHPLEYGIDISVHTASKYLGGHSDLVAGAVISSKEICRQIQNNERVLYGACIDPHQAWLLQRGMRTMKLRLEQHAKNALIVAQYLKNHPYVKEVYYPGLKEGPQKHLIEKYLKGFNGLMSFVIDGDTDAAKKFLDSVTCFLNGCSWGGFESLAVSYTVGYSQESCDAMDCPMNLIRLHVGLENVDTLIADLEQALEKTRK
ncbi:MAG: aminotransferase class I/II-fold pyridoxal phosphate-dependent enzyme [Lachnospiraceae bacterium]|nr:aminotransferase class I/II-fold pyridoxal phosphate-dependent enzyme [Lachnospiraceae bacterium]